MAAHTCEHAGHDPVKKIPMLESLIVGYGRRAGCRPYVACGQPPSCLADLDLHRGMALVLAAYRMGLAGKTPLVGSDHSARAFVGKANGAVSRCCWRSVAKDTFRDAVVGEASSDATEIYGGVDVEVAVAVVEGLVGGEEVGAIHTQRLVSFIIVSIS